MVQRKQIRLGTMRLWVRSVAKISGLRIGHCHELWCRLQTWLRTGIAVALAVAGSCSSDSTPSPGTSLCWGCGPQNKKQNQKQPPPKKNPNQSCCCCGYHGGGLLFWSIAQCGSMEKLLCNLQEQQPSWWKGRLMSGIVLSQLELLRNSMCFGKHKMGKQWNGHLTPSSLCSRGAR